MTALRQLIVGAMGTRQAAISDVDDIARAGGCGTEVLPQRPRV